MSIITFMLLVIAVALALLGAAGFLVYKLATRAKPPKDFSQVSTPPSFKDAEIRYPLPNPMKSQEEKNGERR
jgi:hypothetical protein